jgi:hypothetical protein
MEYNLVTLLTGSILSIQSNPARPGLGTVLRLNVARGTDFVPSHKVVLDEIDIVTTQLGRLAFDDDYFAHVEEKCLADDLSQAKAASVYARYLEMRQKKPHLGKVEPTGIVLLTKAMDERIRNAVQHVDVPKRDDDLGISCRVTIPVSSLRDDEGALYALLPRLYVYVLPKLAAAYQADVEAVKPLSKKNVHDLIAEHYVLDWTRVVVEVWATVDAKEVQLTFRLSSAAKYDPRDETLTMIDDLDSVTARPLLLGTTAMGTRSQAYRKRSFFSIPRKSKGDTAPDAAEQKQQSKPVLQPPEREEAGQVVPSVDEARQHDDSGDAHD